MVGARYDITSVRGVSWSLPVTWQNPDLSPVNLTGYTARLEVRRGPLDAPGEVLLALTDASGITLGGAAGTISLALDPTGTRSLPATPLHGQPSCYSLKLTAAGGQVTELLRGWWTSVEEVTV